MRRAITPSIFAIFAVLAVPAHAAKYTCTFSQAGNPVGQPCVIDPTTTNTVCQHIFGGNLTGYCLTGKSDDDKIEALWCGFGVPNANLAEIARSLASATPASDVRALAEKPGFAAQSITAFQTIAALRNLLVLYRESQSSPFLGASCVNQ
jgi:hypothetical protein